MKIIVLAGGLSPERDVSLLSGAGICKTLREMGHQAFLLDVFFGLPCDSDKLEEVFDRPDGGLEISKGISTSVPDLGALRKSRPDQSPSEIDQMSLNSARWLISHSWHFTVPSVKTENSRQHSTTWESNIQDQTLLDVHCL